MITERHRAIAERMTLGAVALFAWALRVYKIGYRELWFDEIGQALVARNGIQSALEGAARHAGAAPLDYLITWAMLHLGSGEAILRLPAALWGMGSVVLVAWLGRQWFGRTVGLTAGLLLAITPQHVRYSQELRFYSLGVFMALACVAVFWWAQQGRARWRWVAWCAVLTVGLYSHYYLVFVALACGLWALLMRRAVLWHVVAAGTVAALLFVPWVYYDNVVHADRSLGLSIEQVLTHVSPARLLAAPLGGNQLNVPSWVLWALVALALISFPWQEQRKHLALCLSVAGMALGGAWLLGVVSGYPFYPRQGLIALPWLILAGTAGALMLLQRLNWRAAAAAAACLVAVSWLTFLPDLRAFYPHSYSDRGLVATNDYLAYHVASDDAIVVGGDGTRVEWYAPTLAEQILPVVWRRYDRSLHDTAATHNRLWLVAWRAGAARQMTDWALENGAWDVTPWPNGETKIYVYSATDPDAGLRVGRAALQSPSLPAYQRAVLRKRLMEQLEERGRHDEAAQLAPKASGG